MAVVQAEPDLASTFLQVVAKSHGRARPPLDPAAITGLYKIVRDDPCPFAQFCAILPSVNGREFIARVRKLARRNGIEIRFDQTRGKGSHGTLYYGNRYTVVKNRRKPL